jgi:predicted MPP superfamily phosphohydrolase
MAKQIFPKSRFLKVALGSAAVTSLVGAVSMTFVRSTELTNIEIADVELTLPRLTPAFDGYRLVQISDIHMGTWMNRDRLETVVDRINEQQPDLIAITGDFVTFNPVKKWAVELVPPLKRLSARDGAVAVMGNHDHWTDHRAVRAIIHDSGLIDLSNTIYTLERGTERLHIAGVDDYYYRQDDLPAVLDQLPEDGAAVLLAHEPDFADHSAAAGRFDLQISGHSHGGQVILPFVGPIVLPSHGRKYPVGRYQVGDMIQYTNRGVGVVGFYVRINCRPEITVFTLRAGNQS